MDVNLLLFLFWLASDDRQLSAEEVKMLDDNARDWRNLTIVPIRDARRKLKGAETLVEPGKQEAFRNKVKAVELEAERLQQEALYAFSKSGPLGTEAPAPVAAIANVAAYESALGVNFPKSSVAAACQRVCSGPSALAASGWNRAAPRGTTGPAKGTKPA